MSRIVRVAVTVIAVAALTGCVRFTSVNSFGPDNTVTQDMILALTPDAAEQVGIDLDDLTASALADASAESFPGIDPDKVTIEDYVEGDRRGVHIVARDLTLDEFNAAATGGPSAATSGLGTPMTVSREGDTYVVTIPADPARDLSQVQGGGSLGLISNSVDFALTLEFPGPVKSATAGRVDGKKVVLGLEDLFTPDEIVIRGQATPGIAWDPILRWAGIGAIAVVILGGAALLIVQDKRRQRITNLPPIDAAVGNPDPPEADAGATEDETGSPKDT
jgi:hypothetical protein